MKATLILLILISGFNAAAAIRAHAGHEIDGTYSCDDGVRVVKGACETVNGNTYIALFSPLLDSTQILLYVWSFNWNEQALGSACTKQSDATDGTDVGQCAALVKRARSKHYGPDALNSPTP